MFSNKDTVLFDVKHKRNDKITFMVLGGPDSRIKDFQVSARKFKIGFSLFCMFVFAFGAATAFLVQGYLNHRVELVALNEENVELATTAQTQATLIEYMTEDLQSIAFNMMQKIDEIESLNTEVRTFVGLEEGVEIERRIVAAYTVARGDIVSRGDVVARANAQILQDALSGDYGGSPFSNPEFYGYGDTLEDLRNELLRIDLAMTRQAMEIFNLQDDVERQMAFESARPSLWPMEGRFISPFGPRRSPFGGSIEMHQGIDIANRRGTPIVAAGDGIVAFAGTRGGWGRVILINHGYGYVSLYAHCTDLLVVEGQRVYRGDVIATAGNTGRATGDHLHFGIQFEGQWIDPMTVLIVEEELN